MSPGGENLCSEDFVRSFEILKRLHTTQLEFEIILSKKNKKILSLFQVKIIQCGLLVPLEQKLVARKIFCNFSRAGCHFLLALLDQFNVVGENVFYLRSLWLSNKNFSILLSSKK